MPNLPTTADDVTRDLYLVWRSPRVGFANPSRFTNVAWQWIAARPELSAYQVNEHFDGPSSMLVGPAWCAMRFGQTHTALPDGRSIAIAGEHEDHYDPDFYIYNDVIVTSPTGEREMYAYPTEIFPYTDFHSATLIGDRILLIGCLGHVRHRRPGTTPIFSLDTSTLAITRVESYGDVPGWIFKHTAELSADGATITLRGGQRALLSKQGTLEQRANGDDWSLAIESMTWTRLTDRQWREYSLLRSDGKPNHLFTLSCLKWHVGGGGGKDGAYDREQRTKHEAELGFVPDMVVYAARYTPPIAHALLPERDDDLATRIEINGITVRYEEDMYGVRVTIEGPLAADTIAAVVEDARAKLSAIEHMEYVASAR